MRRRGTISVDVDVSCSEILDALTDDDLIEEMKLRELSVAPKSTKQERAKIDHRLVKDIVDALASKRLASGKDDLRKLMADFVPVSILDAVEAIDRGEISLAICLLDGYANPPPAATAKELPIRSVPA